MNGASGRVTRKKARQNATRRTKTVNTILLFVIFLALYALLQQSFLKGLLYGDHQASKTFGKNASDTGFSHGAGIKMNHDEPLAGNVTKKDIIAQSQNHEQFREDIAREDDEDSDSKDDDDAKSIDDIGSKMLQKNYQETEKDDDQGSNVQLVGSEQDKANVVKGDSSDPTLISLETDGEDVDINFKSKGSSSSKSGDDEKVLRIEKLSKGSLGQKSSPKMKFISIDPSSQGFNNQRGRIVNLFKLAMYLNRTVVLPPISLLSKHTGDDEESLVPYSSYFDEEHARQSLHCITQQEFQRDYHYKIKTKQNVKIDKKEIVLVDRMPAEKSKQRKNIDKELDKNPGMAVIEMESGFYDDMELIHIQGGRSLQGCCVIRFHTQFLDDYHREQAEKAVRLSSDIRNAAKEIADTVSKHPGHTVMVNSDLLPGDSDESGYGGIHLRAWEFLSGPAEFLKLAEEFVDKLTEDIPIGSHLYVATDVCFRPEFKELSCNKLLLPLTKRYRITTREDVEDAFRNSLDGKFAEDSTGIACLEQLVLAWADQFVGTQGSTYSGYVRTERLSAGRDIGTWYHLETGKD